MSTAVQNIPKILVYEMVDGNPIYYKGYKEYLAGKKQLEQLTGSSKFQSFLAAELIFLIRSFLAENYIVFSNELGLQFSKKSWRAADIAVIKKEDVDKLDNKYLSVPPAYVIEIDTKADLSEISNALGYYQEKTEELLKFGVNKIIWIFTETEKIMIAEKGSKKWEILDWDQEVEFIEGLSINIQELVFKSGLR